MGSLGSFILLASFVAASYAIAASVAGARRRSQRLVEVASAPSISSQR